MSHAREGFCTSTTRRLRSVALAATLCAGALAIAAPGALAANGNLPGGTSISVDIDTPANGTVVPTPPATVGITGTASVGTGQPIADTTLVYVVDVSGSTVNNGSSGGCGGNQNTDALSNSVLDCEIAAGRALNQQAIAAGTIDQTGVVFFSDAATIRDSGPTTPGTQGLTAPNTDANGSGTPDVEEVMRTALGGGGTNYEAAVQRACELVQQSTNTNNVVVFLSDGIPENGGNALDDLPCEPDEATFQTFAVGAGASCTNTGNGRGSLGQIAAATGGTCTVVTDVATLPDVIPGVIDSQLTKLELSVDGGAPIDISSSASPALPRTGPASVTYSRTSPVLAPGEHELCVRAHGSDGGGPGSVVECVTVIVLPQAKIAINDVEVNEGNTGTTPATFRVTLDRAIPVAVTVQYATANGTAVAPGDYTGTNGTVTFAPNDTSENVVVQVRGDTIDEPDETFFVNLTNPVNAQFGDNQGKGTIIDDERNGRFTCRASALNLLGLLEPVAANRPNDPCRDDSAGLVSALLNVTGLGAAVSVPNAKTDQTPNNLAASAPAVGDKATAHADTTTASVTLGISATATEADAKAECTSAGNPALSASGKVVGLRVAGQNHSVLTGPVNIPLLLATLRVNHTTTTANSVRRRAIWLDNALLPDVIIGEAIAGYSGNPCDA